MIIKDNKEPLVDIRKACPGVLIGVPRRILKEYGALVRKSIAKMLNQAQKNLPKGIKPLIEEAWRPVWYQKAIYESFIKDFSKSHPKWSKKRLEKEVKKYVAPWKGRRVSGHLTGSAIDIRITRKGRKIPMSTKKLSYQDDSKTYCKKLPSYLQKNRQVLIEAMTKAGFVNYPREFWHWTYGDYRWAKIKRKKRVIYGITSPKKK